jgi:hypothetical protein
VMLAHHRREATLKLAIQIAEPGSMLCTTYLALCCAGNYVAQPG